MYSHVLPCITMYTHVLPGITMYYHVLPCIAMYYHVSPCITMYSHVLPCITVYYHFTANYKAMYYHVLPCIPMHYYVLPWKIGWVYKVRVFFSEFYGMVLTWDYRKSYFQISDLFLQSCMLWIYARVSDEIFAGLVVPNFQINFMPLKLL